MRQAIKLTRSKYYNRITDHTALYGYRVTQAQIEGSQGKYSLVTEDALLIGWSTEAEEGSQYVVGIVLLSDKSVITVQLSSIEFV